MQRVRGTPTCRTLGDGKAARKVPEELTANLGVTIEQMTERVAGINRASSYRLEGEVRWRVKGTKILA